MTYYEVCPMCHGGTCQHTEGCEGCAHSDYMGFVPATFDYEAARQQTECMAYYYVSEYGKVTDAETAKWARLIVDAALGDNE